VEGEVEGDSLAGFRLEEQIGAGGMAVVFRARDDRLNRTVALKVLAPGLARDQEFRERFIRESRAAAAVDHPHIIPVYAAGEADGVLYIAMRFVSGGDLRSVSLREGPLPAQRAAFLLSPVASALDAAHAAGLVHRDIKPANILVDASHGRPDHPYLSDFGLAKGTAAASLTGTGQFLGTPEFCAPEQISGKPTHPQTDQYALACVAFTLLTGKMPFTRGEQMAILWAHMYDPPPSVADLRPDLRPAVDQVLGKALAKVPQDRFASCGEFADSLRSALGVASYALAPAPAVPVSPGVFGSQAVRPPDPFTSERPGQPPWASVPPPTPVSRGPLTASVVRTTDSARTRSGGAGGASQRATAPGHRARRSRGRWFAVAAAVAVVAAGAVVASMVLLSPGTSTGKGAAADGSSSSSPASGASTAIARHSGIATLTGWYLDPDSKGIQSVAVEGAPTPDVTSVDNNDHVYLFHPGSRSPASSFSLGSLGAGGSLLDPYGVMLADPGNDCVTGGQSTCGYTFFSIESSHSVGTLSMDTLLEGEGDDSVITSAGDSTDVAVMSPTRLQDHLIDPDHNLVAGAALSGNTKVAVTGSGTSGGGTHTEYIWSVASGTVTATLTVPVWFGVGQNPAAGIGYLSTALDQAGNMLALSNGSKTDLYSLPTGQLISVVPAVAEALSPDGKLLAAVHDGRLQLWDVATARVVATLTAPGAGKPASIAFSIDGKFLAAGYGNTTFVWAIAR